jgi:hypothetical protein
MEGNPKPLPERRLWVGSGHSAKGLSRYVVVNTKVFLDSADAPQEVIDFLPRNPQGLPLRFLREPRLFENGGEAEGGRKCGSRTQSQSSLKQPAIREARFAFGSTLL